MDNATILVPLDGSAFAESAVPVALGVAKAIGARVELVSVVFQLEMIAVEDQPVYSTVGPPSGEEVEPQLELYLDDLVERLGKVSDVPVVTRMLHGLVAESLETYAGESHSALIVMSTHGRGPLSRAWMGSVADRIVRHVSTPVLLIRPHDTEVVLSDAWRARRILIPLDGSELAESSLEWAKRIGKACGSSFTLVRAVPPPSPLQSPYLPDAVEATKKTLEAGEGDARAYLTGLASRLKVDGHAVETKVMVGVHAARGILELEQDLEADLIAIATHGRGGLVRALLGSVADKVLRGAKAPVLLTRPGK